MKTILVLFVVLVAVFIGLAVITVYVAGWLMDLLAELFGMKGD